VAADRLTGRESTLANRTPPVCSPASDTSGAGKVEHPWGYPLPYTLKSFISIFCPQNIENIGFKSSRNSCCFNNLQAIPAKY